MDYPTISAVFSADWNIFGFDPNRLLAYLVAYFFGPQFRPAMLGHLPQWVGEVLPPCYGTPGPQQAARLPLGWKPNPPPLYYGVPSGPYLPSPKTFSPSGFASMLCPHPRAPIGFVSEAKSEDTGETHKCSMTLWKTYLETVFNVTIRFACGAGACLGYFIVPSDIEWWTFHSKVCKHLGANSATACLAYWQFHDVLYGDEHGCAVHHRNAHSMHSRLTQNNAFCRSANNTSPTLALSAEAILSLGAPPLTLLNANQGPADPPITTHLTI
jgi:hypothetical protein